MASQPYNQQRPTYVPNGAAPTGPSGPTPGAVPLLPNQGRIIHSGSARVLCIADIRGNLQSLNQLAADANATHIIHTGDFGFYDERSIDRIAEKTLKHVIQYSPLLGDQLKRAIGAAPSQQAIKDRYPRSELPLSELPLFLNGTYKLKVPVYTVWGACEDVQVLEKLRSKEYNIENLFILDEANSRLLDVGGVKLRLLGLGGAVVMHKLFDNGEGRTTIAGGQGTMWTTLLQMGELVDTANRVYDPTETRVFVTHASPAREGLLNQLSVTLKADFSISAGLHFRYGSSYNEFSVNPSLDHYRGKLAASKASFNDVWETVRTEVEPAVQDNEPQQRLLNYALDIVSKMPAVANGPNPFGGQGGPGNGQVDESAFKNMWNFNLADAAYGWLVLDIDNGRIGTEMRAQGFNFSHRGGKVAPNQQNQAATAAAPPNSGLPPTNIPSQQQQQAQQANRVVPQTQPRAQPQVTPQQPRVPSTQQANRTGPSPSPAAPKDAPKSSTPQPGTPSGADKASEIKTNGAAAAAGDQTPTTPSKDVESKGIFIRGPKNEDEAKGYLAEEDRTKARVERHGHNFVLFFDTATDATAALDRIPKDITGPGSKPVSAMPFRTGGTRGGFQGRSGAHGAGRGYTSGGGASDSEGGRGGRGGFRGRGQGSTRGDRGGRGGRGGRGTFGKPEGGASSPAAASGPLAGSGGGDA